MILVARVVLDVKKIGVRDLAVDGQDCLTETSNMASTRSSTYHTLSTLYYTYAYICNVSPPS